MNKTFLIGNVGKDPEIRMAREKKVATFTLATSDGKELTTWHNIVAWEKTAELIEKYVKKGDKLAIVGRISNRSYEDKDGNKRYTSEIIASEIELLGSKHETTTAPTPAPTEQPSSQDNQADDGLPF